MLETDQGNEACPLDSSSDEEDLLFPEDSDYCPSRNRYVFSMFYLCFVLLG